MELQELLGGHGVACSCVARAIGGLRKCGVACSCVCVYKAIVRSLSRFA